MSTTDMREDITRILSAQLSHAARVSGKTIDFADRDLDLREDCTADELDMVTIAMDLEVEFGIDLPDRDFDTIRTIGDLQDTVEAKLALRRAA